MHVLVWEPGICTSQGDVRVVLLWLPRGSHVEKQHKTGGGRTRASPCGSPASGSEHVLNTVFVDACGRV